MKPGAPRESGAQPIDRIGFDMLRAIAAARQAGTITVQNLTGANLHMGGAVEKQTTSRIPLLNKRTTHPQSSNASGAFRCFDPAVTLYDKASEKI